MHALCIHLFRFHWVVLLILNNITHRKGTHVRHCICLQMYHGRTHVVVKSGIVHIVTYIFLIVVLLGCIQERSDAHAFITLCIVICDLRIHNK